MKTKSERKGTDVMTIDPLYDELLQWKVKQLQKPSIWTRTSKQMQKKFNQYIPEKVHHAMTKGIQKMVEATLKGQEYLPTKSYPVFKTLQEKEAELKRLTKVYQKTAALEGIGTGAGGLWLGLADFPLLLGIKMKFLFEVAAIYGYDTSKYEERLFLLTVFQLAFSKEKQKEKMLERVEAWENNLERGEINWQTLQQEYRDYIDMVKLMQVLPGVGALVGGVANYHLIGHLAEYVKFSYRFRHFQKV